MPTLKPKIAKNEDPDESRGVFVDEFTCIGCKQCVWTASATFRMEPEHGKSRVFAQDFENVNHFRGAHSEGVIHAPCHPCSLIVARAVSSQWLNTEDQIQASIECCPVDCIHWVDKAQLPALEYVTQVKNTERLNAGVLMMGQVGVADIFGESETYLKYRKEREERLAREAARAYSPAQEAQRRAAAQALKKKNTWGGLGSFEDALAKAFGGMGGSGYVATDPADFQTVVGPGDVVMSIPEHGTLRLGPGLSTQDGEVCSTKSGILKQHPKSGQLSLEGRQKRYIPSEGDMVVGTIVDRHAESFVVDAGAPFFCLLPQLAFECATPRNCPNLKTGDVVYARVLSFEGATRRNRPNLKTGDVVYARVVSASRDMEPQLACTDTAGRSAGFGHMKEGITIQVSTAMARRLLSNPQAPVLEALGASLQFELAVGMNGRVWLSAPSSVTTTILVGDVLQKAELLTDVQCLLTAVHLT
eukprot:gene14322-20307_t